MARTPLAGGASLTLTSEDAAETVALLGGPPALLLHAEGWAHFSQGAASLREALRGEGSQTGCTCRPATRRSRSEWRGSPGAHTRGTARRGHDRPGDGEHRAADRLPACAGPWIDGIVTLTTDSRQRSSTPPAEQDEGSVGSRE